MRIVAETRRAGPIAWWSCIGHTRAAEKPEGLETFHRAILIQRPGQLPGVRVVGSQSSGATLSLARSDALLVLPAKGELVEQGAVVEIIPL